MRRHRFCILGCCAAGCLAVEPVVRDLRVIVEARPTTFDYTWQDEVGSRSGSQHCDQAWSAGLGLRHAWPAPGRPVALLGGIEAVAEQDELQGGSRSAALVRVETGLAIGLDNRWTLLAAPCAGLGRTRLDLTDPAFGSRHLAGPTAEYGGRLGLRCALDRAWSVGLDTGWLWSNERLEGDGTLDIQRNGAWVALGVAWTMDPVAQRLE